MVQIIFPLLAQEMEISLQAVQDSTIISQQTDFYIASGITINLHLMEEFM